ncbi:MAG: pilus assembly protein, partial [Acidimicrobiia bacterium]|nr:pilus assembly protein [Acidimicrobiia bacterium]
MDLRDEQGTTLIEFTLVAVAFILLLVGILEFGLAFRDRLSYNNAVAVSARVGSRAGTASNADWLMLEQLEDGLAAAGVDDLQAVWVYKSKSDGTPEPGFVNYYEYTGSGCGWSPCPNPADPAYTGVFNWAPGDRSVDSSNLDRLGVRVYFTHLW